MVDVGAALYCLVDDAPCQLTFTSQTTATLQRTSAPPANRKGGRVSRSRAIEEEEEDDDDAATVATEATETSTRASEDVIEIDITSEPSQDNDVADGSVVPPQDEPPEAIVFVPGGATLLADNLPQVFLRFMCTGRGPLIVSVPPQNIAQWVSAAGGLVALQ